jgi:NhaA family Na+:H+ antiporter
LNELVARRMHQNISRLAARLTISEALDWLRRNPPPARVIYFYVVDDDERLVGVLPTRRLILSPPATPLADIMVRQLVTLPDSATVLEACEFFIQYRLLAFPVVDDAGRLLGAVDIDLYAEELARLAEASPVTRWLRPVAEFLRVESVSGVVLLAAAAVALVLANSPLSAKYAALWQTPVRLTVGGFVLDKPLLLWVNDGLMTLFFFVVGLEIKRELAVGELRDVRKALLPVVAALGGMVMPAVVYLLILWGRPGSVGWGIPTATDIAFVAGFLALLGPRVPHGLKILLLTLAIADDIGATLVIALAYTADLSLPALAAGAAGFGLVLALRRLGVRRLLVYFVVGCATWLAVLKSGVHPTVAGVALGLLTPARPWPGDRVPLDVVTDLFKSFTSQWGEQTVRRREPVSPLDRLERVLHPWVAYIIMPVFALANAGVTFDAAVLLQPVAVAVAAGLVVGKPVGIVLFSLASVKAGLTHLPRGVSTRILVGAGCLAGIGFTMSLFIASLALRGVQLDEAKIGILGGSAVSAAAGSALLARFLPSGAARRGAGTRESEFD